MAHGKRKPVSMVPMIIAAVTLVVLDVWLILWTPGPGAYKSPVAVPVVSGFLVVLVFFIISQRVNVELGGKMRVVSATADALPRAASVESGPTAYTGALQIVNPEERVPLSLRGIARAKRARRIFDQTIEWHLLGIWLLMAATLGIRLATGPSTTVPFSWPLTVATLVITVLGRLISAWVRQNSLVYLACLALHAAWLAVALFMTFTSITLSGSVAMGGFVALAAYAWILKSVLVRLRRRVLAVAPVKLLFLWVFGSWERINSLFLSLGALWRCVGSLQLLRGGDFLTSGGDFIKTLRKRDSRFFAKTPEEATNLIGQFRHEPHPWQCMYATNSLLCSDSAWQHAFMTLLEESPVVLMDLSGFSRLNQGCAYELGQLIDRVPTSRVVLLVDRGTDLQFLRETVQSACRRMAPASPNRAVDHGPLRVYRLQQQYGKDGAALLAIQRDAERVFELLCDAAG